MCIIQSRFQSFSVKKIEILTGFTCVLLIHSSIIMTTHSPATELVPRLEAINIRPGDIYHHYKSVDAKYEIIALVLDEETEEPLVVYRSVQDPRLIWVRKYTSWCERVEVKHQDRVALVDRFSLVSLSAPDPIESGNRLSVSSVLLSQSSLISPGQES